MKTVLITGAAGDVGTHLRRELAGRYKLVVSDRKPITDLREGETFVRGRRHELRRHARSHEG
jgi:uronate dehydrogenase